MMNWKRGRDSICFYFIVEEIDNYLKGMENKMDLS